MYWDSSTPCEGNEAGNQYHSLDTQGNQAVLSIYKHTYAYAHVIIGTKFPLKSAYWNRCESHLIFRKHSCPFFLLLLCISSWPNVCVVNKRGILFLKHMQFSWCFKLLLKKFCFKEVHNNYPTPMRWIITSLSLKSSGTANFIGLMPNAEAFIKGLLHYYYYFFNSLIYLKY